MNGLHSRPLITALLLSLAIHLVLLLPWRHGEPLASGILQNKRLSGTDTPRLDVFLPAPDAGLTLSKGGQGEATPAATPLKPIAMPQQTPVESPAAGGIPIDALYYYAVKELEQRPILKRQPEFNDAGSTDLMANGSAILELLIERDGHINAVNIVRTDLLETHLQPLRQAFSSLEYTPGEKQGMAVRSRVYIEVSYVDGVISSAPSSQAFPRERAPHVPLQLPADWRKRKENPPPRSGN